jgi:hypothetical protein
MIAAKWLGPCLRAVHNAYQKRPVLSDCIVGFSCFTVGEWAAQWYSGRYEHEYVAWAMHCCIGCLHSCARMLISRVIGVAFACCWDN